MDPVGCSIGVGAKPGKVVNGRARLKNNAEDELVLHDSMSYSSFVLVASVRVGPLQASQMRASPRPTC